MKAWFATLAPRERMILITGGGVAAIIIIWAFILSPLRTGTVDLGDAVASKQRLLINVQRAEALPPADGAQPAALDRSLVVLVSNTAQQHSLEFRNTRPDGTDGINVTFQSQSFDNLVDWLITMEADFRASVETASFSSAREPGLVNGQVLLRRF